MAHSWITDFDHKLGTPENSDTNSGNIYRVYDYPDEDLSAVLLNWREISTL